MPSVGLMVRVVGFGSKGPEFKSRSAVELILGGFNSACHPSEVGKMSASMLVYCRSDDPSRIVPNSQGDCLSNTNALYRVWSQSLPLLLLPTRFSLIKMSLTGNHHPTGQPIICKIQQAWHFVHKEFNIRTALHKIINLSSALFVISQITAKFWFIYLFIFRNKIEGWISASTPKPYHQWPTRRAVLSF